MPATPPSTELPRSSVLRLRADFERVRKRGRRRSGRWLTLNHFQPEGATRMAGFVVPKACGGAVERNRIKRRMREIYRHLQGGLPPDLHSVWIARRGAAGIDFTAFHDEMTGLYLKESLLDPAFTPNPY